MPTRLRKWRHSLLALGAGLLIGWIGTPLPARTQELDSLPLDVALAQPSFPDYMPISLAPNGVWVAYTLQSSDRFKVVTGIEFTRTGTPAFLVGCAVWLTNVENRETLRIAGGDSVSAWAPQWSPDGRRLAFYSDQDGVARLWIWDASTQAATPVSDAIVRPFATLEGPRWTPDSRAVVTRILPHGMHLDDASIMPHPAGVSWDSTDRIPGSTVVVYRTDSVWRSRPRLIPPTPTPVESSYAADLALIDISTGVVTTLAHGYRPFDYWVSPNGRFVAFTSTGGLAEGDTHNPRFLDDLVVTSIGSVRGSEPQVIAASSPISPYGTGVAWSPDGNELAYAVADTGTLEQFFVARSSDWKPNKVPMPDSIRRAVAGRSFVQGLRWAPAGRVVYVHNNSALVAIDVARGGARVIARAPHAEQMIMLIDRATGGVAPLTDVGSRVVATRNDSTKRQGFARINLHTGAWVQLREEESYHGSQWFQPIDVSGDGQRIVYMSESPSEPQDLWWTSSNWSMVRRVTTVSLRLADRRYGSSRLIEWRTSGGKQVHGALLLPTNYAPGRRYPLIVYPYPHALRSNDVFHFGLVGTGTENMQIFASRGYAVLAPDTPILAADQLHSLADFILPGVDKVIAMGIADSTRLAVMGTSWGGYTVLALLVQTRRFRAAIMRGGYGDLPAIYGELESSGSPRNQILLETWLGATVWGDRSRYIENSPSYLLDRVRTPLLIVHGGADTTVPAQNGEEIFVDLRRLGQDVEYARYDGENHVERFWSNANQRDYLTRTLRWFDSHLRVRVK